MHAAKRSNLIRNRTDASNLRVVANVFPEYITIRPASPIERSTGILFTAHLTERGLAFITPRKIVRKAHAIEVRA